MWTKGPRRWGVGTIAVGVRPFTSGLAWRGVSKVRFPLRPSHQEVGAPIASEQLQQLHWGTRQLALAGVQRRLRSHPIRLVGPPVARHFKSTGTTSPVRRARLPASVPDHAHQVLLQQ
jgi:hypothetical protein